jgi:TetR/AcrR family transcriptional regulator, acrAB operon repressor
MSVTGNVLMAEKVRLDENSIRQTLPQIRKAQTRTRLLNAAQKVFAKHGYDAASVSLIAAEAGISKGALYVHFDSKEALFREILLGYVQRRSAATAAQLGPDVPLRKAIVQIIEGAWNIHQDGTSCSLLSTEFFALAGRSDWGRDAMAAIFDHCSVALVRFLDGAKGRGEVRADIESTTTARLMLALHDGLVLQWQTQPDDIDPKAYIAPMSEMIIAYISARNTAP